MSAIQMAVLFMVAGGPALRAQSATTVTNNGTISGGFGAAVVGNANITWVATGTRLGSIS